jgi:hypothetical protein
MSATGSSTDLTAPKFDFRSSPESGLKSRIKTKRDEAADKFSEYPELSARLVEIFRTVAAVDKEVSRVNGFAPPGEHRRLKPAAAGTTGGPVRAAVIPIFCRYQPMVRFAPLISIK